MTEKAIVSFCSRKTPVLDHESWHEWHRHSTPSRPWGARPVRVLVVLVGLVGVVGVVVERSDCPRVVNLASQPRRQWKAVVPRVVPAIVWWPVAVKVVRVARAVKVVVRRMRGVRKEETVVVWLLALFDSV